MPKVILSSAWYHDLSKLDPSLSDQVRLLIVVKNRDLQLVVIWGIMNCESKFLVPISRQREHRLLDSMKILPPRCLASSLIGLGLFGFFAQPGRAVRVLLTHRLPIWKILRTIDDDDQSTDFRTVHGHVGVYSCCVCAGHSCLSHLGSHVNMYEKLSVRKSVFQPSNGVGYRYFEDHWKTYAPYGSASEWRKHRWLTKAGDSGGLGHLPNCALSDACIHDTDDRGLLI